MSMFSDIVRDAKRICELCVNNSETIREYAERFFRGHSSFLGPGSEKKWYGTHDCKPDGSWNRTAEKMLQNFARSITDIRLCQRLGEDRIKKQRRKKDINTLQWQYTKH